MDSREGFERGRFEIQRRLGAGGMGVVYEAMDHERGSRVALKTLKQIDGAHLYRFKGEFRKLADIAHPNLVRLYELFCLDDEWFFTMELLHGESFVRHVRAAASSAVVDAPSSPTLPLDGEERATEVAHRRPGHIDLERLRSAVAQLAHGVDALHRAGRLHRDLKPSNVLVERDGRVVICDFGLVLANDGTGAFVTQETKLVGTAAYMSPEQAARQPLSPASDWYSVGVMLFEALTGRVPFEGSSADVLRRKTAIDAPRSRELSAGVPDDLDELCKRLLERDPRRRASGEDVLRALERSHDESSPPSASRTRSAPPFVGRAEELAVLRSALEEVRRGTSVTLFCVGASGVGKTALMGQFLSEVRRNDAVVLTGRCFERESVPYKAFDSLIDALSAHLLSLPRGEAEALVPRDVSALARLFPVLRRVDAVAEAPLRSFDAPDPRENRRRAFGALREILARIASKRLLLLWIDDLQWGDVDSAALLDALVRQPGPPPFLFIGCCRASEADAGPFVSAFHTSRSAPRRELRLGSLTPAEARDLSVAVLGSAPGDLASSIARESGGNPFFITELVRYVEAGATLAIPVGEIRPALDGMLGARLAALDPDARGLLDVIAVAGRALAGPVAAHAAGLRGAESHAMDVLREQRLVRAWSDGHEEAFELWHDRIRETVVGAISADDLRDTHARLAVALRAAGDADPQELVDHLLAAGQHEQARHEAIAAAKQAAEALAFARAAALFALALELAPEGDDESPDLRRRQGDALACAGRGAESARVYLDALEGSAPANRLELRRRAAEQLLRSGHFDEGLAVVDGVLRDVGLRLPKSPRNALATLVWRRALRRIRGLRFRERDESDIPPGVLRRLDVCWTAGVGLSMIDLVRGESFQTHHLLMALRAGEPYRIARAVAMETVYIAGSGRFDEARVAELSARATVLAERAGNPHGRALALVVGGIAALMAGRFAEGLARCQSAEPIFREQCIGVSWELATMHYFEIACLYYMGELGELSARIPHLLRDAEERSDLYASTSLRTWPSNITWLAADDPARARAEIDEAMSRWSYGGFQLQHVYALFARTQVDLYERDAERALARIYEGKDALNRSLLLRARNIRISLAHLEARACLQLLARGVESERLSASVSRAQRTMRDARIGWCAALGSLVEAGNLAARGEGGGERFGLAATACRDAGLGLFAAAAQRRAGELDGKQDVVEEANAWMRARGVLDPERMTTLLAPGVDDRSSRILHR